MIVMREMKELWRALLQKTLRDSAEQVLRRELSELLLKPENRDVAQIVDNEDLSNHFQDVKLDNIGLQDVVKSFIIARVKFVIKILGWEEIRKSVFADFGDSSGVFLRAFGKDGTSVNIASEIISHLKSKGMKAIKADIDCSLPFRDDEFDYILLFETLEHLPNPLASLREIYRVCRKALFVSIPYATRTKVYRFNYGEGIPLYEHHIFEFSDEDFRKIVSHTDFKIKDFKVVEVLGNGNDLLSKTIFLYWRLRLDRDTFMGCHKRFVVYYLETKS